MLEGAQEPGVEGVSGEEGAWCGVSVVATWEAEATAASCGLIKLITGTIPLAWAEATICTTGTKVSRRTHS